MADMPDEKTNPLSAPSWIASRSLDNFEVWMIESLFRVMHHEAVRVAFLRHEKKLKGFPFAFLIMLYGTSSGEKNG